MRRPLNILLAGGGTGGHLFPGVAIASKFMERNPENRVLFMGAGNPFERSVLGRAGFPLLAVRASGLKKVGRRNQIRALVSLPLGIGQSLRVILRFRPDLVIGLGGYSAGPAGVAAWGCGVPVVLQEQNRLPGITNRLLAPLARRIYISFPDTRFGSAGGRIRMTGNPVRREILARRPLLPEPRKRRARSGFHLLVVGGSQGARPVNRAVVDALGRLSGIEGLRIIHQTGAADREWVTAAHEKAGIDGEVGAFFEEMDRRYAEADLIIGRAGATTVAEITALGVPAIFIPFPQAADDHQRLNAAPLAAAGAAEMILQSDLRGDALADRIIGHVRNREGLRRMTLRARGFGRPWAADAIVNDCHRLLGVRGLP